MKKVLPVIFAFFLTNNIFGQTFIISNNPTFDSVMISPNNPTSNDTIEFILYISNEVSNRVFYTICDSIGNCDGISNVSNDTIYIYTRSMEPFGFGETTNNFIDTVKISGVNYGSYTVILINKTEQLYTTCVQCPPPAPLYQDSATIQFDISSVGTIVNHKNKNIMIYPTLVVDFITIKKLTNINIQRLNIRDIQGKLWLNLKDFNNLSSIDLGFLNKGLYFIEVITDDNSISIDKIIKM